MLSLQMKSGEYVTIGDNISVQIFEKSAHLFQVSIQAPREIRILRGKLHERTGEKPDGVFEKPVKSPSEKRDSARQMEKWTEKQKKRQKEMEFMREMQAFTNRMEALVTAHGDAADRDKLNELREKLNALTQEA